MEKNDRAQLIQSSDCPNFPINGLDDTYYAYCDLARRNTGLKDALQNFSTVNFSLYIDRGIFAQERGVNPRSLVKDYPRFAILDNNQFLVDALNASRSIKHFNLCCTMRDVEFGPRSRYGSSHQLRHVLEAFERLRPDICLKICLHVVVPKIRTEVELPTVRGFPSQADRDYVACLQKKRSVKTERVSLMDDWVSLRAVLSNSLCALPESIGDHFTDLGSRINRLYDYVDENLDAHFSKVIAKTWQAHYEGDREKFDDGKREIRALYDICTQQRSRAITEGIKALSARDDEQAVLGSANFDWVIKSYDLV